MRRAIYPGSFDPVTNGHVDVVERAGKLFDQVIVAVAQEANAVIRGLRAVSDFEFEFQMALMNRKLAGSVETIFLMPKEEYTYLSSRIIKEIARLGGDVSGFFSACVAQALSSKFS